MKTPLLLVAATFCLLPQLRAQTHADAAARASLSAGMGVEYASYSDVTGLINVTALASERFPEFKSAVEFFGAFALPFSDFWLLKFEYAYTLASWSPQGAFGPAAFSVATHMRSVILQYMLTDRGVYNVRVGVGGDTISGAWGRSTFRSTTRSTGRGREWSSSSRRTLPSGTTFSRSSGGTCAGSSSGAFSMDRG